MTLTVEHHTQYKYTEPIFPEPSHLYLFPSGRPYFSIQEFELVVTPEPTGLSRRMDVENNFFFQMWFNDTIDSLDITSRITVAVEPYNPFDFLIETEPKTPHEEAVGPYIRVSESLNSVIHNWLGEWENMTDDQLTFVTMIGREIGEKWEHTLRYESHLLAPDDCFASKVGSCRDLSWMLIQMLRSKGIPARFVSGYAFNPELEGHELHGWVEAWLRGAGWVGLDPSSGLLTTEYYIPLAASYHPVNTLPVQGTFRGQANAELTTNVTVSLQDEESPV